MKKIYCLVILMLFSSSLFAQKLVEKFDGTRNADSIATTVSAVDPGTVVLSYDSTLTGATGGAALKAVWTIFGNESWGGYASFNINNPTGDFFDFSAYDSVRIRYYIEQPNGVGVDFKFKLIEQPDTAKWSSGGAEESEAWITQYSDIWNGTVGWHELTIPLSEIENANGGEPTSGGFATPTWEGTRNDGKMQLEFIQSLGIEWSCGSGVVDSGIVHFDKIELLGERAVTFIAYDGKNIPSSITMSTGWSGEASKVTDEDFSTDNNGSIKVYNTDQWDGVLFESSVTKNLSLKWQQDSLSFAIKAEAGTGDLSIYFWDKDNDEGKNDYPYEASYTLKESDVNYDGTWKQVKIALKDFDRNAGAWEDDIEDMVYDGEFDSSQVAGLKFIHDEAGLEGKTIYLDNIWTGNPVLDVVDPAAPQNVSVGGANYINTIIWSDVEGESGEVYNVYYSPEEITDLSAPKVEVAKLKIAEGEEKFEHALRAPKEDKELTYYYVITCIDAAGNESVISANASATTVAKGVAVIHFGAPANFAADGVLTEWNDITPFVIDNESGTIFKDGSDYSDPSGDADLSGKIYLAVDATNLYIAIEVEDDIVVDDTTKDYWYQDGVQLFLGLYDAHGLPHTSHQQGSEPDYELTAVKDHFYVRSEDISKDAMSYFYKAGFPTGYTIEIAIPWTSMKLEGDELFVPARGQRIPVDFALMDIDEEVSTRNHYISYSPNNQDQSGSDVSRWLYTWVGSEMYTGVEQVDNEVPQQYSLSQNYPNPFNPSTKIEYTIVEDGKVSLEIFNVLGQKVETVVNEVQQSGTYHVTFNASKYASGVYFYTLKTGSFVKTKKMMLVK